MGPGEFGGRGKVWSYSVANFPPPSPFFLRVFGRGYFALLEAVFIK